MNSKRLMSICLVSSMAVVSVAGCSKSNVRKIEGASDEACKFVSMTEEIFDMKAVKETITMDISAAASADGEKQEVKGKVTVDALIDESGNVGETLSVDISAAGMDIKGDICKFSFIGNTAYFDMSGVYSIVENIAGQAVMSQLTQSFGMTDDELKGLLSFSVNTGDLKASDFSLAKMKDVVLKLDDDIAKAYTDAKLITVDKDTYTVSLDKDASKTLMTSFVSALEGNVSEIYDAVIAIAEGDGMTDKFVNAISTIAADVTAGIKEVSGEDVEAVNTDEIKKDIEDGLKELKDKKDDNIKQLIDALKNSDSMEIEGVEVESQDVNAKMVYTDEKDGYSFTMDMSGQASVEGQEADTKVTMSGKVSSTTDKVTAPENSQSLSKEMSSAYKIVTGVMSLFMGSAYDDYETIEE